MPLHPRLADLGIQSVKTIVFDAVGTLIYAEPNVAAVYQSIAEPFGWSGSSTDIKNRFTTAFSQDNDRTHGRATNDPDQRDRWRAIVGRVFSEMESNIVDSIFEQLWVHFADPRAWQLYPDAVETMQFCKRHGIKWCIASNFDSRLHQVVAGHPLLSETQTIFCSSLVGFEKPSRQFFDHICEHLNQSAEELIMVGDDRKLDYVGAKNAGWHSLWLDRTEQPTHNRDEPFRIRSLVEIVPT